MRPTGQEKRAYRSAQARIKESIALRDLLPGHTYPGRESDLELMRRYHEQYGVPEMGLWARVRRLLEKGGS